jgi:hypothetical protein
MRQLLIKLTIVTAAIALGAAATSAQTWSDLNGRWKMNQARSKGLDPNPWPNDVVLQFERQGQTLRETLTVVNANGKSTSVFSYNLDGSETINRVDQEDVKSTASWKEGNLVLEWKDQGGTFTRILTFANDRRTVTVSTRDTDSSIANHTIVLDRL